MDGSVVIGVELEDQGFADALQQLRQTAGQTAVQALDTLNRSIRRTETAFKSSASAGNIWSQRLLRLFSGVQTGAAELLPRLQTLGRTAGSRFLSGLVSVDGAGAGRMLASGTIQGFGSENFSGAGRNAAERINAGFCSGRAALSSAAHSAASGISGAFSGGWYSVGYNIAGGIASGIWGGSYLIAQAAVSAAQSALSAAKRSLGIRSPSRVFRDQVGRMIPAGMAQGIRAGERETQTALQQQSERLVRSAKRDVTPPTVSLGGASRTASPESSLRSCAITLEAPLYLDGREVARATARYTGQQLMWEAV